VRGTSITVTLPGPLATALDAEARRRLLRRGDVLAAFMREAWPNWVGASLARDLWIIDAEVIEGPADAETPPVGPAAHHDELSLNAERSLPLPRPDAEARGGDD
jgi:hypothetical protein